MKAERYREQFAFLRENNIVGPDDVMAFLARTEETLSSLTKQRTIFNVRKKRRKRLYSALALSLIHISVSPCVNMRGPI